MTLKRDADRLAIEQCLWWASNDFRPEEALAALGIVAPVRREPDWHDVQLAAALLWRRMCDIPQEAADPRQPQLRLVACSDLPPNSGRQRRRQA